MVSRVVQQICVVLSCSPSCIENFVDCSALERTSGRLVEHIVDMIEAYIVKDIHQERVSARTGEQYAEQTVVLSGPQVVKEILDAEILEQMKGFPPKEPFSQRVEQITNVHVQIAREIRDGLTDVPQERIFRAHRGSVCRCARFSSREGDC